MKLGEAIRKRDYYHRCLIELTDLIKQSSTAIDEQYEVDNRNRIVELFKKFEECYTYYQKFNLLVSRRESTTMIPLDDGSEVTIKDALSVKEAMLLRYNCYRNILDRISEDKGSIVCIDIDTLYTDLMAHHNDILNIDSKIDHVLWSSGE